ncbi:microsomal glutathione S-transferase 2 [Chaetodon trifascialis]|uniref:microsomal glutathione S-transferase 2 n=1 Tax=Chaetodon trifascialis TaxID=109706 RepID=UPI003993B3E7
METDAPILLAAVSFLSALQMARLARRVGLCRLAFNIKPPSVTGPPEFQRIFRAHQNCVECYPLFLVMIWTCGMFFNEMTAVVGGLVYMVARQIYFEGYIKSGEERLLGFYLTLGDFAIMSLLTVIGLLRGILLKYFQIQL